jgi:polyphosphate kinase 2 (PPK2 family)
VEAQPDGRRGASPLEQYTKAKEAMLVHTHIAEAPWQVVQVVDEKEARLNCIAHLLD